LPGAEFGTKIQSLLNVLAETVSVLLGAEERPSIGQLVIDYWATTSKKKQNISLQQLPLHWQSRRDIDPSRRNYIDMHRSFLQTSDTIFLLWT